MKEIANCLLVLFLSLGSSTVMPGHAKKEKEDAYEMYAEWGGYQGYYLIPRLKIETLVNEPLVSICLLISIGALVVISIGAWMNTWQDKKHKNIVKKREKGNNMPYPFVNPELQKTINMKNEESYKEQLFNI